MPWISISRCFPCLLLMLEQAKGVDRVRGLWVCSNIAPLVLCLGHRQHKEEFSHLFKLPQTYSPSSSLIAARLKLLQGSCGC